MRVTCHSVADFLENLRSLGLGSIVFERAIYVDVTRRPLDGDKTKAAKFAVDFQASAVIQVGQESEYLLQVGVGCGIDYEDKSQEKGGSLAASVRKREIEHYCETAGLIVKPGILDF